MRRTTAPLVVVGVALTLTGCSSPEQVATDALFASKWVLTERGDVRCAVNNHAYGMTTTDCDWSTLTEAHAHTSRDEKVREGAWLPFGDDEEIYCLINPTSHGNQAIDCDYESVR